MSNDHSVDSRENRRKFLGSSVGLLLLKHETAFGSQANSTPEVGVIGIGGRGTWLSDLMIEHTGARPVALADAFADRLEAGKTKFKVDSSRLYRGFDAYKELLASKVDAVLIESPAYFHPVHAAAAVAAGKHVYVAKPVAIDVPGCESIRASGERARGKVTFLVDFQTRARPAFQEVAARIHRGEIGKPAFCHVYYHGSGGDPKPRPQWSPDEARLRYWNRDKVLSGDIIVEQNIHALDVANWYLQGHPIAASGSSTHTIRMNYGDCRDSFVVTFQYPNDVTMDFSSVQFVKGYYDICIRLYGTDGTADTHYGLGPRFQVDPRLDGYIAILGAHPWKGADRDDTFTGGAIQNLKDFIQSIKTGNLLNNAAESADSNLTSILGRTAGYRGGAVTWDEMMKLNTKLEAPIRIG